MDQFELIQFLKEQQGVFFSAEEIADKTASNIISIYSKLNQIAKNPNIARKEISVGPKNKITVVYSFVPFDNQFRDLMNEFEKVRSLPGISFKYPPDTVLLLMLLREVREIKEVIKNENK